MTRISRTPPSPRKVLVVDDDADLRRLGQLSLAKVGQWEVVVGASGREAVALALQHLPDVVLLDVSMPDMDGPTALSHLRRDARTAHIPIVFITARALPQEIDGLLALGAAAVITKPFDALRLAERLAAILGWDDARPAPPAPAADAPSRPAGLEAALAAQRAEYQKALPRRVQALAAALDAAREKASGPLLEAARVMAHKLRGSAGAHGLGPISEAAASIEEAIRAAGGDARADGLWEALARASASLSALVAPSPE